MSKCEGCGKKATRCDAESVPLCEACYQSCVADDGRGKSAAIVTIKGAPRMTAKGRKSVAAWLRRQAGFLENHADKLSNHRFCSRYLYR